MKTKTEINENVLKHFSTSNILCVLFKLKIQVWMGIMRCRLFYFSLEWTVLSRTVFTGHRCLQVQRHRQRCQCQCPVTNAQRPPLLYPAAYFLILQGSPALLKKWPCWRACFQQAIWTHALPTPYQTSPSLALSSLKYLPTIWLICDHQGDYRNLLHISKVWWTLLSTPLLWLYLSLPISV